MYTMERNSQDRLEAIFPKKEMSLFLVSHSTKITLVWAQKGTKMQIWVFICTSDHAPVYYLRMVLRRWRRALYTSQNILGSQMSENHDPFRKSDVIKMACGPCQDCRYPLGGWLFVHGQLRISRFLTTVPKLQKQRLCSLMIFPLNAFLPLPMASIC